MNPQRIFRLGRKWICDVCAVGKPDAEPHPWTAHPNFSCGECGRPTGAREVSGDICVADACTEPEYYSSLCRAHYGQRQRGQELKPLRKKGTKQIGVRVTPETLEALGESPSTKAAEVLESWAKKSKR